MAPNYDYDLLVIGSGPAGQRAAIQGAKLDKRVAIIERTTVLGGVSVNLGTIPSKTLREAVLELSGYRSREFYGASYTVKQNITMQDLLVRTNKVIQHEIDVTRHQLMRNGVEVISATASFDGPETVRLDFMDGSTARTVTARHIVIAAGTETTRDPQIPLDGKHIFTSDDVLQTRPPAAHAGGRRRRGHRLRIRQHLRRARRARDVDRPAQSPVAVRRRGDRRHAVLPPAGEPRNAAPQRERPEHRGRRGRGRAR